MALQLAPFADAGLTDDTLAAALERHEHEALPRLERLWRYYRNPMILGRDGHGYRLGQEVGLPARLVGRSASSWPGDDRAGPGERVIENDIAWRVQSMVDFLLGRPVRIISTARDEALRGTIERVLDRVWEASGGIALLQDMALLGQVYGHVDLLLRVDDEWVRGGGAGEIDPRALRAASGLRVEVIEPRRGVAFVDPHDYRALRAYAVRYEREVASPASLADRVMARMLGREGAAARRIEVLELVSANAHQVYENGRLLWEREGTATGGEVPIVHVQNVAEPFAYSGLSEVEPLIPLQDELNTRLSDRATRVTFQSFRMYLAKGVEGFERTPVRPGQVWSTDNHDAKIEAFGGDAESPSEAAHIAQIREAMDKVSGVPPLAGGVVQGRIGNLSSANALRITLMSVLAKTARKRVTYGRGIARMCGLILAALDQSGALPASPEDRGVRLEWPDPLPEDVHDTVLAAKAKVDLGVPEQRVLEELGYRATDQGIG
ncbi:MAG: hypothetical protein HBSAPP03_05080 [Phycisphaerae bacterium]|nr:MAG: hypothetical protein HBSAPP03_05080 [Phycisphaerae bacterium]